MRVLVGMQATLMQVPPTLSRSTMTTLSPALARSMARDLPALPPPTTSRSTSSTGTSAWLNESLVTVDWDMDTYLLRRSPVGAVWTPEQRVPKACYSGATAGSLSGSPLTREESPHGHRSSQPVIESTYSLILTNKLHRSTVLPERSEPHPESQRVWRNSYQWERPWQSPRGPRYPRSREVTPGSFAPRQPFAHPGCDSRPAPR